MPNDSLTMSYLLHFLTVVTAVTIFCSANMVVEFTRDNYNVFSLYLSCPLIEQDPKLIIGPLVAE